MYINIIIRKELSDKDQWSFSGTVNFSKDNLRFKIIKIQLDNGMVLFEGNLTTAMKWIMDLISGIS